MQGVEDPTKEFYGVALSRNLELAVTPPRHLLDKLVRRRLRLEKTRIPQPLGKCTQSLNKLGRLSLLMQFRRSWIEEESAEWADVQQEVNDDIEIVIGFDVVETDVAWKIWRAVQCI